MEMMKSLALVLIQLHFVAVSFAASGTMILIGPNLYKSFLHVEAGKNTVEFGVFNVVETGVKYVAESNQDCRNLLIPIHKGKDWFGLCEKIENGANSRHEKIASAFVTKATAKALKKYTCVAVSQVMFVPTYKESFPGWILEASLIVVVLFLVFYQKPLEV